MTQIVRGKMREGGLVNMLVPDIHTLDFIEDSTLTYLDILYAFAQFFPFKNVGDKLEAVRMTMLELQNRITQMEYFAQLQQKQEKKLLAIKNPKRISSYKPFQIFLGLNTAYLDSLHSLRDILKEIDKLFGKKFSLTIRNSEDFRLNMDLRNLMHHLESPLINIVDKKLLFTFKKSRILKLSTLTYFTKEILNQYDNNIEFELTCDDLLSQILLPLNEWALSYLNEIDQSVSTQVIMGNRKNGSYIHKNITLKELMDKAAPRNDVQERKTTTSPRPT